ncbi:MAG TPA: MarR family transcriptional regulator [Syntrophomonadaceae bacterium]|nr:MarR family transcriptional regulator [Syntrophomonadaceae bacterium]
MSINHEILIDLLRQVNKGIGSFVKDILDRHGIPVTTMIMARQIGNQPGITISSLSRQTGIAKSHISNIIRDLEQRDWVEKRTDASDQRILRLYLTPSASEHLKVIRAEIKQQINALVADIPEQEALDLIQGLTDIKTTLDLKRKTTELFN